MGVQTEIKEEARQLFYERKKGLLHDVGVWGGADEQIAVLGPAAGLIPLAMNPSTRWITRGGIARGKKRGEEPPKDMRRCIELFWQIEKTIDEAEQIRLMKEIIALNRKNLWVIAPWARCPRLSGQKFISQCARSRHDRLGLPHPPATRRSNVTRLRNEEEWPRLDLSDRTYMCHFCGLVMDRDLNAALNIKDAASPAESLNGRGDFVRRGVRKSTQGHGSVNQFVRTYRWHFARCDFIR